MQAVHRPVIILLPDLECGAPAAVEPASPGWPRLGHDRHAYLETVSAGCGGKLSTPDRILGRLLPGARFDFADELRLAHPPSIRFEPAEAGYSEVCLRLVLTPRVYFHSLRHAGGGVRLTVRNTLDNTADLHFRVEVVRRGSPAPPPVERTDNLPPNMERDYEFTISGGFQAGDEVLVTMEKGPEALEGGYRFQDQLYASK